MLTPVFILALLTVAFDGLVVVVDSIPLEAADLPALGSSARCNSSSHSSLSKCTLCPYIAGRI